MTMRLDSSDDIFEYKKKPSAGPGAQGGQATQDGKGDEAAKGDQGVPGNQEGGVHEEWVTDSESDAEGGQQEKAIPAEEYK